ncbi:MAG: hypothetical protein RIC38_03480 [Chromatocurvus sp.]
MTERPPRHWPPAPWQRDFLQRHQLPTAYLEGASRWFDPLALRLRTAAAVTAGPLLVGINGCQGSGKSTLCDYVATRLGALHACNTVVLSLDDFYLSREERRHLAATVHPLFATRGVPGTHDMSLLTKTLDALSGANAGDSVEIPRFDKAADDRRPATAWDRVTGPVDIILLEGWCLGARPEASLEAPVNALEAEEDADGCWRQSVNEALKSQFVPLYARVGVWVMLRAPAFDAVYQWRLEQEHKLARTASGESVMSDTEVARFIQFYQRLTCHCLATLPRHMDVTYNLDNRRDIDSATGLGGA